MPVLGSLFALNHKEAQQTDVVDHAHAAHRARARPGRRGPAAAAPAARGHGQRLRRHRADAGLSPSIPIPRPRHRPTRHRPALRRPRWAASASSDTNGRAVQPRRGLQRIPLRAPGRTRGVGMRRFSADDIRAERNEALDEILVAALDGLDFENRARAFGRQRRGDERHARADVAAVERAALELRRAGHDDAVRIAEEQIGAHRAQLLEREETQLVHPVVHERPARRPASPGP